MANNEVQRKKVNKFQLKPGVLEPNIVRQMTGCNNLSTLLHVLLELVLLEFLRCRNMVIFREKKW